MKPAVRAQLSKDYMLEEDEIKGDVREKVTRLCEGIRMLEGSGSGGDSESEDGDSGGGGDGSEY